MRRLFVSDLHLADPDGPQFRTFAALLEAGRATTDELYVLGDLCEVWVGDDDDGPLALALTRLLAATARHMRVYVMHGNRDFLFGPAFAARAGVQLIDDPHPLPGGILLAHGDSFCIDDDAYQAARALLRTPAWQAGILARDLASRRALALQMRAESAASNANKAENIMDVNAREIEMTVAAAHAQVLVHGHTHRPGIHHVGWGTRYVLGAWDHCAWYLRADPAAGFTLACLPLMHVNAA